MANSILPVVSIITPTYNHENYILDCINSVKAQSFQDWEMIIVDDGSTDRTFELALKASESDERISVYTQANVGIFRLAETYNFALSIAKGEYIAVLEGDDVWLPDKLELQVNQFRENEHIVLSFGNAFSSSTDLKTDYSLTAAELLPQTVLTNYPIGAATQQLLLQNFIVALTVVVKTNTLKSIGGFKQSHNLPLVDVTTWNELSLKGNFGFIQEPLGKWRFYPNQITKVYTAEISEGFYQYALEFYHREKYLFKDTDFTIKKIHSFFREKLVEAHSRSGRYKLIRKDFRGARKNYIKSILGYGFYAPMWKLRSIIGFAFSLMNKDVEGLSKKMGKVSYK